MRVDLLLVHNVHSGEEILNVLGHSSLAALLSDEILVDLNINTDFVGVLVSGVVCVVRFKLAMIGRVLMSKAASATELDALPF